VRGPASLLYGNNALGGVVNVISNDLPTSIPEHVDGYLNASSESATPGGATAIGVTIPLTSTLAFVGRGEGRRGGDLKMGEGVTLPTPTSTTTLAPAATRSCSAIPPASIAAATPSGQSCCP
jgi:iron complex outermembrane receptor protein